jgi:hypothetical protein
MSNLERRRLDPAGNEFGPDAYVFGNEIAGRVKSVRQAWDDTRRGGRSDELREQDPLVFEPEHDDAIPEHPAPRPASGDEKLEESRRLAEEERRRKAEEQKRRNAESVAQTLHTDAESAPAFVPTRTTRLPLNVFLFKLLGWHAEGGIRTPTLLRAPAPQAGASASSATSANGLIEAFQPNRLIRLTEISAGSLGASDLTTDPQRPSIRVYGRSLIPQTAPRRCSRQTPAQLSGHAAISVEVSQERPACLPSGGRILDRQDNVIDAVAVAHPTRYLAERRPHASVFAEGSFEFGKPSSRHEYFDRSCPARNACDEPSFLERQNHVVHRWWRRSEILLDIRFRRRPAM